MSDSFETRLQELAQDFSYPVTPSVDAKVMEKLRARPVSRPLATRQLTWGIALVIALLAVLMAVPPVRAAVLEFIRIGVVRIFVPPTPAGEVPFAPTAMPGVMLPVTATPGPTAASSLIPLLNKLAGETTLEEARQTFKFPILLPTYPPDLGQPDRVFLQRPDGQMVVLIWLEPNQPDHVLMSLHFIENGSWVLDKMQPKVVEETTVNGLKAAWTVGPYPLLLRNRDIEVTRLIDGHVLIWADDSVTYRLETDLSLEEAVRVAESLKPLP